MVETTISDLEGLQALLVKHATGGGGDENRYIDLRRKVLADHKLLTAAPPFLKMCRSLDHFWQYIKTNFSTYAERRAFLWESFNPLIEAVEKTGTPADVAIAHGLTVLDSAGVSAAWAKALARRTDDPEGAITSARTLLESVCKYILDSETLEYERDIDLPALYKKVAHSLNLAPSQHTENVFKQILGGCTAVVEGLGSLRNRLGDAHGQGKRPVTPISRHAELAVNLSGSLATFLVATYLSRKLVHEPNGNYPSQPR